MEICGHPKEVWNSVWNCRKAAISTDPTFVWKFVDIPKRSETGLKPSETVGKQLCPLILHLYGNLWASRRGLKQVWNRLKLQESSYIRWSYICMEFCGRAKEVWNRSETVWKCRKAAMSADPTFVWKFVGIRLKPSETVGKQLCPLILHLYGNLWASQRGLKQVWNRRKAAISADPTFVWIFVDIPKRSETGLKPSETVGKQLYPLILHLYGNLWTSQRGLKQVWTVWNCRKAAISADPTFVWKFVDVPKRSESGLKPSETVGKQLYPLILHLYGNLWTSQRGLKQVWNRLKL